MRSNSGRMNVVVVAVHTIERQLARKVLNDLFHHSTNFRDAVINHSSGSKWIFPPQGPRSLREHVLRRSCFSVKEPAPSLRAPEGRPKISGAIAAPGDNVPVTGSSCAYSKQYNTKPTRLLAAHHPIN